MYKIKFTGERITEESAEHGDFAEAGWIDPSWSMRQIFHQDNEVTTYTADNLIEAVELIESCIGAVETDGGGSYYAADVGTDYDTGDTWHYAAHIS